MSYRAPQMEVQMPVSRSRSVLLVVALVGLLALPAAVEAHPPSSGSSGSAPRSGPATGSLPGTTGPCTKQAAKSMPDGRGHDHLDITQHRFQCNARLAFFDPLLDELDEGIFGAQDAILGEIDIENDVLAIAVAFPESGVLFYDVQNPAEPEFIGWYRSSQCEELVFDVDCGAYVDLSEDGTVAFLSLQDISVLPQQPPDAGVLPVTVPGVEVIDVDSPVGPTRTQIYPLASGIGGTHTSNSHVIPADADDTDPRAPGEYLFSVKNVNALHISEVNRVGGVPFLTPVSEIELDELHDMYIDNDPLTGRTYVYIAGGFATGFYVYDVTDPAQPEFLGEWDPTPECAEDWYGHTTFTVVRNGRRYVTIDAELFGGGGEFGEQSAEDQAEGCGRLVGNGDRPGPLWIVDATNFENLQRGANPTDGEESGQVAQELKQASLEALVSTWTNPAGRAAGNIEFSPHNQQVVGNRIYLSHYHGGVYQLDATAAFAGESTRPREMAFVVPHNEPIRPLYEPMITDPLIPFIAEFFQARPTVWDTLFYKGFVIIVDSTGGLYSYKFGKAAAQRQKG
ncbi:MAG TPA: hypothetical protein VG709_02490 [Actinomycetota bacterium]|nr:hypothetical protein [Actinomycetota bacterium]